MIIQISQLGGIHKGITSLNTAPCYKEYSQYHLCKINPRTYTLMKITYQLLNDYGASYQRNAAHLGRYIHQTPYNCVSGFISLFFNRNHNHARTMSMGICFASCRCNVYPLFPFSITSFRCSWTLVVAYTQLRDALVWGECRDKVIIKVPQTKTIEFPREFFVNGEFKDTGSSVHPGMYLMGIFISFMTNELMWNSRKRPCDSHTNIHMSPMDVGRGFKAFVIFVYE